MEQVWVLGLLIAFLISLNTLFWGLAVKELGEQTASIEFFFRLIFNMWFMLAMLTAFVAALMSYFLYVEMGVMVGRFFLSLSAIGIVLVGVFILKEPLTLEKVIGILLVGTGSILLGRI